MKKAEPDTDVYVPYVYYFLLAHKDDLLVPLMRGAANVSLSIDRLKALRVPLPQSEDDQRLAVECLERRWRQLSDARLSVQSAVGAFREEFERFCAVV